ncbi:hypothetical protein HNV12_04880 [Methanococcoides sp. SA1]|nr:hypothetical protein [Methanococcoides sp. SA1]
MNKKDPVEKIQDNILSSDTFKNRKLHSDLLIYLIKAHQKGQTPKEMTIAYDVFHKDNDFNPSEDTIVRVHMHKLRKLLEHYYEAEGKHEDHLLSIPKGHYKILITSKPKNEKLKIKPVYSWVLILLVVINIVFLTINVIVSDNIKSSSKFFNSKDCVWKDFFTNDNPNTLIIGDFFVFHEHNDRLGRSRRIQDYEINTKEEFEEFKSENIENIPENWILGELPHNSIFNLMDINSVSHSFNEELDIAFTTNIDIDFIKNRDIIYIGEFKNLRALEDLVALLPIKYETLPWWHGTISYESGDSIIILNTHHDWNISRYVVDLGIVAKIPGENDENYIFFTGFGYNSQIELVNMYCNEESLKSIKKQILQNHDKIPDYFVAVYEVAGFDRASSKVNMKYFKEISKNMYKQYNPAELNN